VPVRAVGEVDDRRLAGRRLERDRQAVLVVEPVADGDVERARVAVLAVGGGIREEDAARGRLGRPQARAKPVKPPCRLFGGWLIGSSYVSPSSVKRPRAMRLP
jgi:hypothetical protein